MHMSIQRHKRAASVQQYAILIGLIAVIGLVAVIRLGNGVQAIMQRSANSIGGVVNGGSVSQSGSGAILRDCAAIKAATPGAADGAYTINPAGTNLTVWCDMTTDGGGWTLISKFSGTESGTAYYLDPAFNLSALANTATSGTGNNAKMANSDILGIVNGRVGTAVTFRAVSSISDKMIQVTSTGIGPFDPLAAGDQLRCKLTTDVSWFDYSISSSGCYVISRPDLMRVSTWQQGCGYVASPCGDGNMFSLNLRNHQYIDAGYTSSPTRPGIWYIR